MASRGMAAISCQINFWRRRQPPEPLHILTRHGSLCFHPLLPHLVKSLPISTCTHKSNFYTTVHAGKHVLDLLQWGGVCTYWPWASICVLAGTDVLLCMQQAAVLDPVVS